jgi:hypothetical protein
MHDGQFTYNAFIICLSCIYIFRTVHICLLYRAFTFSGPCMNFFSAVLEGIFLQACVKISIVADKKTCI